MSRAAGLALAFVTLVGSSCCCCSGDFFDLPEEAQPSDEPAIEAAAREHVAQHHAEIFAGDDARRDRRDLLSVSRSRCGG